MTRTTAAAKAPSPPPAPAQRQQPAPPPPARRDGDTFVRAGGGNTRSVPASPENAPARSFTPAQSQVIQRWQQGAATPAQVVDVFGGRDRVREILEARTLPAQQYEQLLTATYQYDLQNHDQRRQQIAAREREEQRRMLAARGSGGIAGFQALQAMLHQGNLLPITTGRIRTELDALRRTTIDQAITSMAGGTPQAAMTRIAELRQGFGLSSMHASAIAERTARRMVAGERVDQASQLRALDARHTLDEEARLRSYTPMARAVRSLDLAASLLDRGDGDGAATFLETEARALANTNDPVLRAYRDTALARAAGYRATAPAQGFARAGDIQRHALAARRLAAEVRGRDPRAARFLEAMATDSTVQARLMVEGAANTDSMIGRGLVQTYRQIVHAAFQREIDNTGTLFGSGARDALVRDQGRAAAVFDRLNRMMQEQGLSLHDAWIRMFDNHRIDSGFGGFPTAHEAAAFIRDNPHSRGLLIPLSDMSRGLHNGSDAEIERARVALVQSLRDRRQWDIADQIYRQLQGQQMTPEARAELDRMGTGRGQWWGQVAGNFIERELPLLLLTGVVSGGAGWAARAGASALSWGTRTARTIQVATELGAFVPTHRVLGELLQGQRADWSPGALARDYALTLGGYGLFRGIGAGWRALRGNRLGPLGNAADDAFQLQGAGRPAAAGPAPRVTVVNPTGPEAAEAARAAAELRRIAGMLESRPQDVEAALRALTTRFNVNWKEPLSIGRSQLANIRRYADELVRANPGLRIEQALDLAAADFMSAGRAIGYFRDPATGALTMPRGITYYGTTTGDAAVEQALLRAHSRMLIEEYAHGFGYSIRPGSYVPLDPRMQQFQQFIQTWLQDPANQAALAARYQGGAAGIHGSPHEADIMGLLGGMNPFEVDRYAIRLIMEEFLRLYP